MPTSRIAPDMYTAAGAVSAFLVAQQWVDLDNAASAAQGSEVALFEVSQRF